MIPGEVTARLEYLRGEIEAECISMLEILELESLAQWIDSGDTLLLQWANVAEFPTEEYYDEATGMEYTYHPHTGILESCSDGVGLVTERTITSTQWEAIQNGGME